MNKAVISPVIIGSSVHVTTIGAVCDKYRGDVQTGPFGDQLHASDYVDHGVPVVMPQDMVNGVIASKRIARVADHHADRLSQHILRENDIVYSRRGDVSRFAIVSADQEGWLCGTGSIRVRLNCPIVSITYLKHYLKQNSVRLWLEHHAKGVTMLNLNTSIIRALPIGYPPLPEQHRIAAILDQADALRVKRRAALAQLDEMAQAIFVEMFGDPISNPCKYLVKPLADLIDIRRPITYGILMPGPDVVDGVPYVRVVDMVGGAVKIDGIRRTSPEVAHEYRRSTLRAGDLLISIRGHVGRVAVTPQLLDGANITQDTARLAAVGVCPSFLKGFLEAPAVRTWMNRRTKGAAVRGINLGDLKILPVILPNQLQQATYAERVQQIQSGFTVAYKQREELDALFTSLQHRAFTGAL